MYSPNGTKNFLLYIFSLSIKACLRAEADEELSFENSASIYSISNTSNNGGLIGWVSELQISNKIKKAINACKKYNAVILDRTKKSNVIQITALRREIDKMTKNLRKLGLVSVSRTGAVAMTRGDKIFN